METRWFTTVGAILCLVLAGCSGDPASEIDVQTGEVPTDDIRNGIEGRVLSSDFLPLELAEVGILSLNVSVFTNSDGRFRIVNLDAREYLVSASKPGYKTLTRRATIEDGKIFEIDFPLDEKPLLKPYKQTTDQNGRISCSAATSTNPEDTQQHNCGSGETGDSRVHEFQIQANAAQIVIEVDWEKSTEASAELELTAESVGFGHQDIDFGVVSGPSPLKIVVGQRTTEQYYTDAGFLRTIMDAAPSVTEEETGVDSGFAFQQDFTVYVTVFYVEPGPPSFTAVPPD